MKKVFGGGEAERGGVCVGDEVVKVGKGGERGGGREREKMGEVDEVDSGLGLLEDEDVRNVEITLRKGKKASLRLAVQDNVRNDENLEARTAFLTWMNRTRDVEHECRALVHESRYGLESKTELRGEIYSLAIQRRHYAKPTVVSSLYHDESFGSIAYLRIVEFADNTFNQTKSSLRSITRQSASPISLLVIDLRQNTGGLLSEAAKILRLFTPFGRKLVSFTDYQQHSHTLTSNSLHSFLTETT